MDWYEETTSKQQQNNEHGTEPNQTVGTAEC